MGLFRDVINHFEKKKRTSYKTTNVYAKEFKRNYFNKIDISKKLRALDVGIGYGKGYYALKKLGFDTYGIDTNKYGDWSDPRKILADCKNMPFKTNFFDVVNCSMVLDFIEDDNGAIREVYRVLKSRGMLIIRVVNKNNLWSQIWQKQIDENHTREYSIKELTNKLTKNGFRIKKISTHNVYFPLLVKHFQFFMHYFIPRFLKKMISFFVTPRYRAKICVIAIK